MRALISGPLYGGDHSRQNFFLLADVRGQSKASFQVLVKQKTFDFKVTAQQNTVKEYSHLYISLQHNLGGKGWFHLCGMRLEKCKYPLVRRNSQMYPISAHEELPIICIGMWTALNFYIGSRLCGIIPQERKIPSWLLLFLGAYSIPDAAKCCSRLMW